MKAVLCPVCSGSGRVYGFYGSTFSWPDETCYGCNGKGWVEVSEEMITVPPHTHNAKEVFIDIPVKVS